MQPRFLKVLVIILLISYASSLDLGGALGGLSGAVNQFVNNVTNAMNNITNVANSTINNLTNIINNATSAVARINITFAPPPNITSTAAGSFATNGNTYKTSNRLEVLQISPANSAVDTQFKYSFYNSSAATKFNQKILTLPGTWTYVTGTQDTLSCIAVKNSANYSLLKFDSAANRIDLIATNPLLANEVSINAGTFKLKENCGAATIGDTLSLLNSNDTSRIDVPSGWFPIKTESLAYGVANGSLYRFNSTTNTFTAIHTFNRPYEAYSFKTVPGRLIVSAASVISNATISTGTQPVDVAQTFFFFADPANGSFRLIGQLDINSTVNPPVGSTLSDPSRFLIDFSVSPSFGKFVTAFSRLNGNATTPRTTIFKTLDFTKGTVTDITFKDVNKFTETSRRLAGGNRDLAITDNFFVIRNQSAYDNTNTSIVAVEETYQFQGNVLNLIRNRILTDAEMTSFKKIVIDAAFSTELMVVVIDTVTDGFAITATGYSSLAAMTKIAPTPIPAYVSFMIPDGAVASTPANALGWIYKVIDTTTTPGSPTTNSTFYRFTPNVTGNVISTTTVQNGQWSVIASAINDLCHVEKDATTNYKLFFRKPSNSNTVLSITPIDITTALTGLTLTGTWILADNCERFSVDGQIFRLNDNKTAYIKYDNVNQAFSALDQNINVGIVGDKVYALVPGTNQIINTYNHTSPILPNNNRIYSLDSKKVVITATNATSAQILAFNVNTETGTFTNIMNYVDSSFSTVPSIRVSPGISKVLLSGASNGTNKILAFNVDYSNEQYVNITLPTITVANLATATLIILDQFIYVRDSTELIFYIDKDINALQVSRVSLTSDQVTNFRKAALLADPNGKFFFLVESSAGSNTQVNVNQNQVSVKQAILNSQAATAVGAAAIAVAVSSTGQLKACPPGCSDCSTGYCTSCVGGFSYDTTTYICNPCGPNCLTCNSPDYLSCLTCAPGTFLSASKTCDPCDSTCVTCSNSATSCSICPPGKGYYDGGCNDCSRNCLTCTANNTCTACRNGFAVANGRCRGCAASCSSCNPANITECTSCANGLYLLGSKCVACPNNCLTCSDGNTCSACVPGMTPNSNNVCILNCQLPCITCLDNQPTKCTSCYYGSTLSGNTCVFDASCNDTSSCTDCGQGLNLYLDGSECYTCPAIANCLQCSTSDADNCARCANGYFIDSDYTCTQCQTQCTACLSTNVCTACATGYTLLSGQSSGSCAACTHPCATCQGSSNYCLSCVDGYIKKSWKCQRRKYVSFRFVLNGSPTDVLAAIDAIISSILAGMGENSTNTDAVTISSVVAGSTVVDGSATPTDSTVASSTVSSSISASLSSGIGGFTVTSSSLTLEGEDTSTDNTGLIVGLVVGLTAFVGIVILVSVIIYKKKAAALQQVSSGELHVEVKEDSLQEVNHGMNKVGSTKKLGVSDS